MLTNHQNTALTKIKDFLESPETQIFILKGYAGTGKTTLVKYLCDYLNEADKKFMLAAPTGRAARILSRKSGQTARTVHSVIYNPDLSFQEENEDEEKDRIYFPLKNDEFENTIMIVDEASMVGDKKDEESFLNFGSGSLLADIFNYLRIDENYRNKIIFVGDPAQLPPVNDNVSPALDREYLLSNYLLKSEEVTLTEIIRQAKQSSIPNYSLKLRTSLENGLFNEFSLAPNIDVIHHHLFDDLKFSEMDEDRIAVSFTNKRSLYYNKRIRKEILGFQSDEIQNGEKLLIIHNNRKYKLFNGDFVTVNEIFPESKEFHSIKLRRGKEFKFAFIRAKIAFLNELNQYAEIEAKLLLNNLLSDERGLKIKEQIALRILAERLEGFYKPKRKNYKNNFTEYKRALEKYLEKLGSSEYFNALQIKFGYAVTCHKAQGGEWKDVIIDFNDFRSYTNEFFYRWAYTAITRASDILYLINSPVISPLGVNLPHEFNQSTDSLEVKNTQNPEIDIPEYLTNEQSKAIYRAVYDNDLLAIENVIPMNYRDRYRLLNENEIIVIDFIYNKKGEVNYTLVGKGSLEENVKKELRSIINRVSIKNEKDIDERELLILRAIEQKLENAGNTINSVRNKPYLFMIDCSKNEERCSLKIYFNKKFIITKVESDYAKSSSNIYAEYCRSLIRVVK